MGFLTLAELAEVVPTAANVEYYARIIAEKALLRRLIRTATHIVSDGYEREDDVDGLLNEAEKKILEVSHQTNAKAFQKH